MAFYVKDETTDAAVRKLARLTNRSLTETIRHAVEAEYERQQGGVPLARRLQPLVERYQQYPVTRENADKAFFDSLSGDE
jgi:antitoxin VapB